MRRENGETKSSYLFLLTLSLIGQLSSSYNAACLSCDYVVADSAATFEHGNLVRGVCCLGMLTETLPNAVGRARALSIYLTNDTLDAAAAHEARLANEVCTEGVEATQRRAFDVSCEIVRGDAAQALLQSRVAADVAHRAAEAVGHAECRLANGGAFAEAPVVADSYAVPPLDLSSFLLEPGLCCGREPNSPSAS